MADKIDSVFDVAAITSEFEKVNAMIQRTSDSTKAIQLISVLRRRTAVVTALAVGIVIGLILAKL